MERRAFYCLDNAFKTYQVAMETKNTPGLNLDKNSQNVVKPQIKHHFKISQLKRWTESVSDVSPCASP